MYRPPIFAIDEDREIERLIQRYPFGLLVTGDTDEAPVATHIPMIAQRSGSGLRLLGHIARANPQCAAIHGARPALAVFTGAHAYISPSWYDPPYPQVPTWNYSAVHARGRLHEATDPYAILSALTTCFESKFDAPWEFARLDRSYVEDQMRGIVAFEMIVERIEGKAKFSQNRSERDAAGAIAGLKGSDEPLDRACAAEMQRFFKQRENVTLAPAKE